MANFNLQAGGCVTKGDCTERAADCFFRSPEIINPMACKRMHETPDPWTRVIPHGNYQWGQGWEKTKRFYYGGAVPNVEWQMVQERRQKDDVDLANAFCLRGVEDPGNKLHGG